MSVLVTEKKCERRKEDTIIIGMPIPCENWSAWKRREREGEDGEKLTIGYMPPPRLGPYGLL